MKNWHKNNIPLIVSLCFINTLCLWKVCLRFNFLNYSESLWGASIVESLVNYCMLLRNWFTDFNKMGIWMIMRTVLIRSTFFEPSLHRLHDYASATNDKYCLCRLPSFLAKIRRLPLSTTFSNNSFWQCTNFTLELITLQNKSKVLLVLFMYWNNIFVYHCHLTHYLVYIDSWYNQIPHEYLLIFKYFISRALYLIIECFC